MVHLQIHYYSEAPPTQHVYSVSWFHAEAPQTTESEGLGPYVVARAGVEPTTLRTIGVDSTIKPPRPTKLEVTYTVSKLTIT